MGDIFDEIAGNVGAPVAIQPGAPTDIVVRGTADAADDQGYLRAQPRQPDIFDEIAGVTPAGDAQPSYLANALRSVVRGTESLGATVTDLPSQIAYYGGSKLASALGLPEGSVPKPFLPVEDVFDPIRRAVVGDPAPRNRAERYVDKALEYAPGGVGGGGRALAAAIASGLGSEAAKDLKKPEWAGALVGALAPGALEVAGRGLWRSVAPFTASGPQRAAGRILRDYAADPNLSIPATSTDPLEAMRSTAEVTQNPGLARLQGALEKGFDPSNTTALRAVRRGDLRQAAAQQLAPVVDQSTIGQALREEGQALKNQRWEQVEAKWRAIGDATMPTGSTLKPTVDNYNKLWSDSFKSTTAPKQVKEIIDDIRKQPRLAVADFQRIRSAASSMATSADTRVAAFGGKLHRDIMKAAEQEAQRLNGISPKQAAQWRDAIDATKNYHLDFEKGATGTALRGGMQEGGFLTNPENVVERLTASPSGVASLLRVYGKSPDALEAIKDASINSFRTAAFDARGNLLSLQAENWVKRHRAYLQTFPDVQQGIGKILDDSRSALSLNDLASRASKAQSITTQGVSDIEELRRNIRGQLGIGGRIGPVSGAIVGQLLSGHPVTGAALGQFAQSARSVASEKIASALLEAAQNPEAARRALSVAAPGSTASLGMLPNAAKAMAIELGRPGDNKKRSQLPQRSASPAHSRVSSQARSFDSAVNAYPSGDLQSNHPPMGLEPNRRSSASSRSSSALTQDRRRDIYSRSSSPQKRDVKALISQQPPIVQAFIRTESSGNPQARSPKGAIGLMQLMPDTARRLGVNPYDPEDNIRGGIKLIGQLTQKYSDPRVAIAAYNLGETKLDARIKQLGKTAKSITWGEIEKLLPAETRAYPGLVEQRFNAIVRA